MRQSRGLEGFTGGNHDNAAFVCNSLRNNLPLAIAYKTLKLSPPIFRSVTDGPGADIIKLTRPNWSDI